jgi:Na+/H+-dicarboxylate symporter
VALGIGNICVIALTATLAAIGAAAIPSAGLVTMLMVLQVTQVFFRPYRPGNGAKFCSSPGGHSALRLCQYKCTEDFARALLAVCLTTLHALVLSTSLFGMQAVSLDRFAADLAVILALDWLLDRCRTAINLLGDAFGVVLIDHLTRHANAPTGSTQYSQLELA